MILCGREIIKLLLNEGFLSIFFLIAVARRETIIKEWDKNQGEGDLHSPNTARPQAVRRSLLAECTGCVQHSHDHEHQQVPR